MVMATVVVVKCQSNFSSNHKGVAGVAKSVAKLALSSYRNDFNLNGNCDNFRNITFHHNNYISSSMIY